MVVKVVGHLFSYLPSWALCTAMLLLNDMLSFNNVLLPTGTIDP